MKKKPPKYSLCVIVPGTARQSGRYGWVAVVASIFLLSTSPAIAADKGSADFQKEELIGIMKGVNVVPQLCKAEVGGNKEPFKILLRQAA